MTTAHRPPSTLGRSRLLMAAVLTAMVASLTVALPGLGPAVAAEQTHELHIGDTDVVEGDDGVQQLEFKVTVEVCTGTEELDCQPTAPEEEVTFTWSTIDGTATDGLDDGDPRKRDPSEDTDYVAVDGGQGTIGTDDTETTVVVEVFGDTTVEPGETLTVRIDSAQNARVGDGTDGTAVGTIETDDPKVSVEEPAPVAEGEQADVTFMLTEPAETTTTVTYQTADSSSDHPATAGDDYEQQTEQSVLIQAGEDQATITIATYSDGIAENCERFDVEVTDVTNASVDQDRSSATVVIVDEGPCVWIDDVEQEEGHSGHPDFTFEVRMDPPADDDVTVDWKTEETDSVDNDDAEPADGPGDNDYDYLSRDGQLTFPAGSVAPQTITVPVRGDTRGERDESFQVELSLPDGQPDVALDEPAIGTILNDDNPLVDIRGSSGNEGAEGDSSTLNVPVELVDHDGSPSPAGADIVLEYWTTTQFGDTANNDDDVDYQDIDEASPATVTIPAGQATAHLPITLIGDDTHEDDETFTVHVAEPDGDSNPDLRLAYANVDGVVDILATIVDDDTPPTITIGDADKTEGESNFRLVEFPVRLSNPSNSEVTVDYNTDDGTAHDADGDYESKIGTVTFEPGDVEATVSVQIFGDTKPEANETFVVQLTNHSDNARFPDDAEQIEGTGTIINDDGPGISVSDVTVDEGDSGTRDAVFRITADTTDHDGFTVDVATADGTATAGSDYTALPTKTLEFDAGESSASVAVPVRGDTDHEDDETFTLQLSNANFAAIVDGEGVATIVNDDEAPVDDGDGDGGDGGTGDDGPDLGEISRSAGATRIETALQVSRDHWDQASDVVLASAATFPDALAGGTLSALLDAPLLLTFPDDLSDGVAGELDRLGTQTVWILGGSAAVSVEIEQQLLDAGYEVHRFFGQDRFATAAEIARGTGPSQAGEVVLALGAHDDPDRAWPDALSAGALAAVPDPLPVLLTTTDSLPDATTSALSDLQATTVYLLGGTAAISEDVEAQLTGLGYEVVRLAGSSRWGTSVAVATEALRRHGDTGAADVVFATGQNFPDGLAAGALAARLNGLLLLVPTDQLAGETAEFLVANALRLDRGVIVGGEKVVTTTVADLAADALIADG